MKKLKFLFFPTILALAFGLMLSCAKSSSDSENQSQCTSVITFQKGISGKQAKQTNDCGYIVAYNGKLTKLDERGETKWESEITLNQAKHSNLGKPSVIQTSDGGYLYSDNDGIAKVGFNGEIGMDKQKIS